MKIFRVSLTTDLNSGDLLFKKKTFKKPKTLCFTKMLNRFRDLHTKLRNRWSIGTWSVMLIVLSGLTTTVTWQFCSVSASSTVPVLLETACGCKCFHVFLTSLHGWWQEQNWWVRKAGQSSDSHGKLPGCPPSQCSMDYLHSHSWKGHHRSIKIQNPNSTWFYTNTHTLINHTHIPIHQTQPELFPVCRRNRESDQQFMIHN